MPGPAWNDDDPRDLATIAANVRDLTADLRSAAALRVPPSPDLVLDWHSRIYAGCRVPSWQYVGAFRGDLARPHLSDYRVALGELEPDGFHTKEGLPATAVAAAVATLLSELADALGTFDEELPVGRRPTVVDELEAVLSLVAQLHGEWVRIHPFANGNGRTARTWVTWLMLRYGLPTFVTLKPRPSDVAYAQAAHASMGRPPDYAGNHDPTEAVFSLLLNLALLP